MARVEKVIADIARRGKPMLVVDDWREDLERRAVGILRRHRERPVTVFCHLLLSAVELHRLRQGLLQRTLFNDLAREAAA